MTSTATKTAEAAPALANFPLPEDRKPAVVRTDVARGLLTEAQARDASRGLGHPDTRIDTPTESDPYVANLAKAAAQAKTEAAKRDYDAAASPLDPLRDGEAGARALDPEVKENEARAGRQADERRKADGAGKIITAAEKLEGQKPTEPEPKATVGNK